MSIARARPCYVPWDRAAWVALRYKDCPIEADDMKSQRTGTVEDTFPIEGSILGQSHTQGRNHAPERDRSSTGS